MNLPLAPSHGGAMADGTDPDLLGRVLPAPVMGGPGPADQAPLAPPEPSLPKRGRALSVLLAEIAEDTSRERLKVGDLLQALGDRAIGALMFVFAFPNVLPAPPGVSAVLGAPLVFLAAQLALGMKPWLPKVIADRSLARTDFAALVRRVTPWLARTEKLLKPRLVTLVRPPAEYLVGCVALVMAVLLALPIPLGNMLPALVICILALGVLERDGVWVLTGCAAAVGAVALVWGVVFALVKSALFLFVRVLG